MQPMAQTYGATPAADLPPSQTPRRSTGRTAALVGVASVLLFAAALVSASRSAAPAGSALAQKVLYDDEYTPSSPVHPKDDDAAIDDIGSNDQAGIPNAQTAKGDNVDNSWADVEVMIDLRQYPYVQEFLEARNVSSTSPEEVVLNYVPKLKLRYNLERAAGQLGTQALSGYVVMCLDGSGVSNDETMTRTASLMLVLSLKGEVIAVRPTPGYGTMGIQPLQMNAMKMRDPYNVLLGANLESAYGRGPLMLYNWRGNFFEVLGNGSFGLGSYTSHDLQYVSSHMYDMHLKKYFNGTNDDDIEAHVGGGGDRVFRPSTTLNLIFAEDVVTGDLQRTIGPFDYARTSDMNHFQLLENGIVIVNGRSSGSWRKYDMKTQKTLWTCGGAFGNFTVIDLDGTVLEPGVVYHARNETPQFAWYGQHNLEYFGENEWFMFNNAYNQRADSFIGSTSRPMKVVLDETKMIANITWAYQTGVHSYIYGDADRLPTGHVLACYWPRELSINMPEQYDTKIVEVVPDYSGQGNDELAWELLVIGHNCTFGHKGREDGTGCTRASNGDTVPDGWSLYSVERFYTAPLATDAAIYVRAGEAKAMVCADYDTNSTERPQLASTDDVASGSVMTLEFTAYDSFKTNLPSTGKWWLAKDDVVVAGAGFDFRPHWRGKGVEYNLTSTMTASDFSSGEWKLLVADAWGFENRTITFTC